MTETTIYTSASRAAVRDAISRIPNGAVGLEGTKQLSDAMMTRCGMTALDRIKGAFIVKSLGGTDEAGEFWKPLAPSTIAYSRRQRKLPGDPKQSRLFSRAKRMAWIPKGHKRAAYGPSYALTRAQRNRWHEINQRSGPRIAWETLKREGATTLMEQYGNMKPEILRDTGILLNSLSPGVGSSEQVFRVGNGEVIVGTNRKWARVHHEGSKDGRVPQRRLWPEPNKWPSSWWLDIAEVARAGLVDIAIFLIKRIR